MRRLVGMGLLRLCEVLDGLPVREDGRWYRRSCLGCRMGVSRVSLWVYPWRA